MWADGIQCVVALSFDLDAETVWTGGDSWGVPLGTYGARVGTPLILSVLEKQEVTATFFVPGQAAEAHPDIVSRVIASGHELAVHGYTHREPAALSAEEEEEELIKAGEVLRGLGVKTIEGYRAPGAAISDHTIDLLARHGYAYDSSIPDSIMPYRHAGTGIVELPISPLFDDWAAYGYGEAYFSRFFPPNAMVLELWRDEFQAIYDMQGMVVMVMHPQLTGRPSRVKLLDEFITFIKSHPGVHLGTCADIAALARES